MILWDDTASVTKGQQDAIREILDSFLSEMHGSFQLQFEDFNDALVELKKAQKDNTEYTSELYKTMSSQLVRLFRNRNVPCVTRLRKLTRCRVNI